MKKPADTRLLIVDDEVDLRDALAFDFKRKGYQVLTASNGVEAFSVVKQQSIDVVISDIRMPGGDGIELLSKIKDHNLNLPVVIFMTAYSDIGIEEAYDRGAEFIFSKPFDRKALHQAVEKAVQPREERWMPDVKNVPIVFSIELNFSRLDTAIKAHGVSIGRGGLFVALDKNFPTVTETVRFKIQLSQDPNLRDINGSGIIRWVRKESIGPLPAGCGIEITFLEDSSREPFLHLIDQLRLRAFIPKGAG